MLCRPDNVRIDFRLDPLHRSGGLSVIFGKQSIWTVRACVAEFEQAAAALTLA